MRLIVLLVLAALGLPPGVSVAGEGPIVIKFSHVVAEDTPKDMGARLFQMLVEERLAGRVRVDVFADAIILDDDEALEALIHDKIQLAAPSLSKFSSLSQSIQVFDLPYLFTDIAAVHTFQTSEAGQSLLDSMLASGIKGLGYWDNGMRVMSAGKPLRIPEEARGLTFRINPSDVLEAQYKLLGAQVLKLPFSMLYETLETGLADGQENTWSNIRAIHLAPVLSICSSEHCLESARFRA